MPTKRLTRKQLLERAKNVKGRHKMTVIQLRKRLGLSTAGMKKRKTTGKRKRGGHPKLPRDPEGPAAKKRRRPKYYDPEGPKKQGKRKAETKTQTRAELYKIAQRLEISGRSKMSKAQLKRAIGRKDPEKVTKKAKKGYYDPEGPKKQSASALKAASKKNMDPEGPKNQFAPKVKKEGFDGGMY